MGFLTSKPYTDAWTPVLQSLYIILILELPQRWVCPEHAVFLGWVNVLFIVAVTGRKNTPANTGL